MGQKSTKLQGSLLPQSQTITSTVAVNWKVSISSCVSPEIIPNCLLFQAVLRTSQHHQPLLHRAVLTELLSPILLQHRLLAYCTNGVHRRGRSSQHMQETEGKGKKNPQPQIQMLHFSRLHNFLKLAFISKSYCSSGEQSQIIDIKTEIILIPVIHNHKSTYNIHHLNLTVRFGFSLLLHLLGISKGSDKKL